VVLPCQAVRERDFKLISDRTLDVSVEGMFLPLRAPVLTGETLIVSFPIPGLWIDVEAAVARVVHGRRPGDQGRGVGVVFDRIAPGARAALAGFLHGRRSPLPRRRPMELADPADVTDDDDEKDMNVDGLDVLRAVVCAWQNLSLT
jgi:hypothetical protein